MSRPRWALIGLLLVAAPAYGQERPARAETFAQLPYWPGYWVSESAANTPISGIALRTGGPSFDSVAVWANNAPWNDEGRRRVSEVMRTQGGRKGTGWGYPLMMNAATPIQVLITPEEVLITNAYNETRHIYTDGRDHPPLEDLWPSVTGNSIGHWEGDTWDPLESTCRHASLSIL